MFVLTRFHSSIPRLFMACTLLLSILASFSVQGVTAKGKDNQVNVASYELIGTVNIPTGTQFKDTTVGGLSSITYDPGRNVYYAISDDQNLTTDQVMGPVRYYTLSIDVADGHLDPGDITFQDVTAILDPSGAPFPAGVLGSLDPEGLTLAHDGQLYFSSEGFANRAINPFINRMNLNGRQTRALEIPDEFLPTSSGRGVRTNLGFESLNLTPDGRTLVTASEGALAQDGPPATVNNGSFARILEYRLSSGEPGSQYVYVVNPVAEPPVPLTNFSVNGLVELLPLDNVGTMLALERSFSVGAPDTGNTIWLYEISTQGATDVSDDDPLPANFVPVSKRLILNVETDLGIPPDNIEGMALGPALPDGRVPLILVSDNNFAASQTTQFIVLAVELNSIPTD